VQAGSAQRAKDSDWGTGRAGMQYRDLIPDRLGGRFIASHIRIREGGPVPDYVHHHDVNFQMIYCYRGWVKVVYEDQGPPFVMVAGDCVLQPPHIRHRVLECSDNMEVVEVSSPAEHETLVDHAMELPTSVLDPDRDFGGQRFLHHEASKAEWVTGPYDGFEVMNTGIDDATGGQTSVQVIRPSGLSTTVTLSCNDGIIFNFVLQGSMLLRLEGQAERSMTDGDSFVTGLGKHALLAEISNDLELLQVLSTSDQ